MSGTTTAPAAPQAAPAQQQATSITTTGAVSLAAGAVGEVIVWVLGLWGLTAPPPGVATTMAALLMGAAHGIGKAFNWWVRRRWPDVPATTVTTGV